MNKENVKKKAKEFWEKNKFEIGYCVGGCVAIIGAVAGVKLEERLAAKKGMTTIMVDSRIANVILDANKFKHGVYTHTDSCTFGIMRNDLGKLAEHMKDVGVPEGTKFTHFIAFGK